MATKKNRQRKQTKPKKAVSKRATPKKRPAKRTRRKKAPLKKRLRGKNQTAATVAFEPEGLRARSGGQAGDLQGLSSHAGADSESVNELLEEGNAFEAEVVKGVQDVADESEVVTHEVPEDDVPKEYWDKEK